MAWLSRFSSDTDPRKTDARKTGAAALPVPLILYTRSGCHLCDELKEGLGRTEWGERFSLREIDVDGDPELSRRYGDRVPVLEVGGRIACCGRIRPGELERRLKKLSARYLAGRPGPPGA